MKVMKVMKVITASKSTSSKQTKKSPATSSAGKVMKKKAVSASVLRMKEARATVRGLSCRGALLADLKESSGRDDINIGKQNHVATKTQNSIPIEQRGGFPLKLAKGTVHPKDWKTATGVKLAVDFSRSPWLPDDWGQGLKITNPTAHSTGGNGGLLTTYVTPDGITCFFHKQTSCAYAGRELTAADGRNGQIRLAELKAVQGIQLSRKLCKDMVGKTGEHYMVGTDSDESFFKLLNAQERKCVRPKSDFHFCVVSARRATKAEGIKDIFMVQMQFKECGVEPTWYVDAQSLQDYKDLGLKAVVGGKLTAARNMAIKDARRQKKVCVQCSDDIAAWEYRHGKAAQTRDDDEQNAAHAAAKRFIVSPVTAAQFILAKMRGAEGSKKPRLGGPYIIESCARTFGGPEFSRQHFILGDFSVIDLSDVLYDETMNLKEDYDFACAHIQKYGSVMRCNRMTLSVKHYDNGGGACSNRDSKGTEEQRNIGILMRKWPGAFRSNPLRKNEVIMRWPKNGTREEEDDAGGVVQTQGKKKSAGRDRKKGGVVRAISKKSAAFTFPSDMPADALLVYIQKETLAPYIAKRCKKAAGMTITKALSSLRYLDSKGADRKYGMADLRYDLKRGMLSFKSGKTHRSKA